MKYTHYRPDRPMDQRTNGPPTKIVGEIGQPTMTTHGPPTKIVREIGQPTMTTHESYIYSTI